MAKGSFSTLLFFSLMICVGKRQWNYSILHYLTSGAPIQPAPPSVGATTKPACIDGNDFIRTPQGWKRIEELVIGDEVAAAKSEDGYIYEEVLSFLHRDKSKTMPGIRFTTSNGRTMTLSHEHLLLLAPNRQAIFARNVRIGQNVFTTAEGSKTYQIEWITKIEPTSLKGLFSPLTKSGTLLINDVLISCYSHWEDHNVMHFCMHWILSFVGYDKSFESDGLLGRKDGFNTLVSSVWRFFRRFFLVEREKAVAEKTVILQGPPVRPSKLYQQMPKV